MAQTQKAEFLEVAMCSGSLAVDREAGVVRGVRIISPESRRGRRYPTSVLQEAAPLYEDAPCGVGHGRDGKSIPSGTDSGTLGRFAWLSGVHEEGGGLSGDLNVIKSHPFAGTLFEAAERHPSLFGLSHAAIGDFRWEGNTQVVTKITRVHSVDVVDSPATTSSLFESEGDRPVKKTLAEVIQSQTVRDGTINLLAVVGKTYPQKMLEAIEVTADTEAGLPDAAETALAEAISSGKLVLAAEGSDKKPAADPDLASRITLLEAELSVRRLLETSGIKADDAKVAILMEVSKEQNRRVLIEGWKAAAIRQKPDSLPAGKRDDGDQKLPETGKETASYLRS